METPVVVRFAPSPTGYLHVGGARTAIFNWLFARKHHGKFILRIEDTDLERSSADTIQGILDGLAWLGLIWDEGPNFQSQFIHEHQKAAATLLADGFAYKCFCSKEELDHKREVARQNKESFSYDGKCRRLSAEDIAQNEAAGMPYTLRFKVPRQEGGVRFKDAVYGPIEKRYQDIEDFIIMRTNGQPLYVLSNAIDDIRDGVTHIIRGQDGLANTPKQILLYQALKAPIPVFAHMSLALDPQKAKISKRKHGESVAVHFYQEHGFLPWALNNFLVLLGWSTSDARTFFSPQELIEAFDLIGISRNNPVLNIQQGNPKFFTDPKAISMNAHYLRTMPIEDLVPFVVEQLTRATLMQPEFLTRKKTWFFETLDTLRERFQLLTDFATLGRAYFTDEYELDAKGLKKDLLYHPELKLFLPLLGECMAALNVYNASTIESEIIAQAKAHQLKIGVVANGVRVVLTGQRVGPGFTEMLLLLGQETVVRRLKAAAKWFDELRPAI